MSAIYLQAKGSRRFHRPTESETFGRVNLFSTVCGQAIYNPKLFFRESFAQMEERLTPCKMGCFDKRSKV